MKLNPDDPQLTAYALGELEPHERAAVEAILSENPECRRVVEEIREAAGLLSSELAAEPCPELTPQQRAAIDSSLEPAKVVRPPLWFWRPAWGIAAVAAALVAVLAWQMWIAPERHEKQLAMSNRLRESKATVPLTPTLSPGRVGSDGVAQTIPKSAPVTPMPSPQAPDNVKPAPVVSTTVQSAPPVRTPESGPPVILVPATPLPATAVDTASAVNLNAVAVNEGVLTFSAPPAGVEPSAQSDSEAMRRLVDKRRQETGGANVASQNSGEASATPAPQRGEYFAAHPGDWPAQKTIQPSASVNPVVSAPAAAPADSTPFSTSYAIVDQSATPQRINSPVQNPLQQRSQTMVQNFGGGGAGGFSGSGGAGPGGGGGAGGGGAAFKETTDSLGQGGAIGGFAGRGGRIGGGGAGFGGRRGPAPYNGNYSYTGQPDTGVTVVYAQNAPPPDFGDIRYYRYLSPPTIEAYPNYGENNFLPVMRQPLSTFSADVDTASYANVRRFLTANQMPPADAVRIEEMVNYFNYNYAKPKDGDPFAATIEVAGCPWNDSHRLVRIGLKGREVASNKRPASSFVFLIDISGSMQPAERLPLIKQAMRALVMKMSPNDRVAIVVYASEAGVRLPSTPCTEKEKILAAIDSLQAGGSTNGGDGIQQAYRVAQENFIEGGVNRVLLATDGDFNVGITDQNQLVNMIKERAKSGVALTTLGVGTDNYKDALMQKLADSGNGNYYYLDSQEEAQKVLIEQMSGTLVTIAKDVKIQVEFNPAQVAAYRLIGYEKRKLRTEDFNNDAKDAGEIGAGHTVTALYEVVPAANADDPALGSLRYQQQDRPEMQRVVNRYSKELLTLKLRYKQPDGDTSRLLEFPITDSGASYNRASADFKFASAVAAFGMILRDSPNRGSANYAGVIELARESKGADENGYRAEFITLVQKAQALSRR